MRLVGLGGAEFRLSQFLFVVGVRVGYAHDVQRTAIAQQDRRKKERLIVGMGNDEQAVASTYHASVTAIAPTV